MSGNFFNYPKVAIEKGCYLAAICEFPIPSLLDETLFAYKDRRISSSFFFHWIIAFSHVH